MTAALSAIDRHAQPPTGGERVEGSGKGLPELADERSKS
jgi:hypothetical protein